MSGWPSKEEEPVNKNKFYRIKLQIFKKFGNAVIPEETEAKRRLAWYQQSVRRLLSWYKLDFVEKADGDWLLKIIQGAWVVWI